MVLAVQDSIALKYTAHPATEGRGPLNNKGDASIGLWMHDTLALSPEGIPLGLIDIQIWARDSKERDKADKRHDLPIEEKESYKWLKSWEAANELQKSRPNTLIVSVGDRESDIYEFLQKENRQRDRRKWKSASGR